MQLTKAQARQIVWNWLNQDKRSKDENLIIADDFTIEKFFGWVFFYHSKDVNNQLAGNAPVIVDKDYKIMVITGSSEAIETYIQHYEEHRGDVKGFYNSL